MGWKSQVHANTPQFFWLWGEDCGQNFWKSGEKEQHPNSINYAEYSFDNRLKKKRYVPVIRNRITGSNDDNQFLPYLHNLWFELINNLWFWPKYERLDLKSDRKKCWISTIQIDKKSKDWSKTLHMSGSYSFQSTLNRLIYVRLYVWTNDYK